ncbi:MAG TPA: RNA polymerase sigma factor [Acidimicrobiales bacterium]
MALRADDVDLGRDRVLVERFQAGDAAAFDDLYHRYFDRLTRFCERRVSDADTAQDLAQEAFLRAYQRLDLLEGDRRFYPWMTVIASRLCIDHHRRSARTQTSDEIDLGVSEDESHRLDTEVDLAHLHEALQRLAPRHHDVLDLRERRGLSYAAIAGELDVNIGVVEQLLFRARRALRREFERVSGERILERLGAVPALGWLLGRLGGLRSRLADATSGPSPAAIGAMAFAIATVPGLSGITTHTPPTTVDTRVAAPAADDLVVLESGDALQPVEVAVATIGDRGAAAGDEPTPSPDTGGTTLRTRPAEVYIGNDDAADKASDAPVNPDFGAGGLGIDPATFVADILSAPANALSR